MRTGNGKTAGDEIKVTGLRFTKDRLVVELGDEREVSVPLSRYPTLQCARPAQRQDWEIIGPGKGFYWKSLDLDLSVAGLLRGLPEAIPAPPPRKSMATRARKSVA
jgi:hypothetical protein